MQPLGPSADAGGARPIKGQLRQAPAYLSHRLLRLLAEKMRESDLEVREHTHGDETIQLAVTNPHDPDRGGRAEIGYGGYLVWERWVDFKTDDDMAAAAEIVLGLLTPADSSCSTIRKSASIAKCGGGLRNGQ